MPIVERHFNQMIRFAMTKGLMKFFDEHRIRTTSQPGVHRWGEGDLVIGYANSRLHSHVMHLNGPHLSQLQSFSYSFSPLNQHYSAGRYCSISWNVRIMGPQHPIDFVTSSELVYRTNGFFADTFAEFGAQDWEFYKNPPGGHVRIGHDVWIGQDVLLKNGITIGNGAVIGAGAVVTKDVAPYEIVGGVPAKRIRYRFDEKMQQALQDIAWWQYAIPQLPKLSWNDPVKFLDDMKRAVEAGEAKPFQSDLGTLEEIIQATD